ncbi:activity-regulated cytoskeleton associated protein 2-like [Manduca sexta]|uniref:activity-regulated cytoskeleton associated protein 2-like n=1 Tax=Manduca sexta TaxID=7130 RepID=UPI00188DFDE2|nr:activity-regulated cytoskeleton associated protein 2-like [Manduca sexta]
MPFPCKRVATRRGQGQAADKEEPQPTTSDSEQEITFVGPSAQASTPTPTAPVPATTSPTTDHMFKIMELFARSQAEANQKLLETIMANTTSASPEASGVIKMKSAGNFSKCSARFEGTTGDAETLEAFIDAVLVFKECAGVTDENVVRGLPMLLTGNAAVWWQGIKKDIHDWEDAIARLRGMYGIVKPAYKLFREIFGYEHTLPERSEVFACKIRALISQLPYDLCDAARINIVYGLLNRKIRKRLPRETVNTFEQLIVKLRCVEA